MPAVNVALVLVGGFGTRLRSAVSDRPKALAPIRGRPFLDWQLDALRAQGITQVVLCTHYLSNMIEEAIPAGRRQDGMDVAYSREPSPLGTGGALRLALESVPAGVDRVLAVNGDTFCAFDLAAMAAFHERMAARATLLLASADDVSRYGTVETDDDGNVREFREKAPAGAPVRSGWISAGVYLLSRAALAEQPLGQSLSIEREVFPRWIGHGLCAWAGGTRFLDIGTPESYGAAESYLAKGI